MSIFSDIYNSFTSMFAGEDSVKDAVDETKREIQKQPDKAYAVNTYWRNETETQDEGIYGYATRSEKINQDSLTLVEKGYNQTPKIRAAYNRLMTRIFHAPLTIISPCDDEKAELLKKYNEQILLEVKGTIEGKLKEMLKIAMLTGYSLAEVVPKLSESKKFEGKRVIDQLYSKRIGLFEFITDEYDNLLSVHSLVDYSQYFPVERFLILSYDSWYNNPYGTAQWDSLSALMKMRQAVFQNAAIYSNWYTSPIPVVEYDDDTLRNVAQSLADNIKANTNLAVPKGVVIKFLEANKLGHNPFISFLEWIDDQISESIVGYDLSKDTGSRAADEVKSSELDMFVESMRRYIEEVYNEQIIRRYTQHNFPISEYPLELYPKASFRHTKQFDKREFMEIAKIAVETGALDFEARPHDLVFVRDQLGYPRLSEQDLVNLQQNAIQEPEVFEYEFETDFPSKGEDQKITLKNSEYPQFDYAYALDLKENYPEIWDKGGNIRGDEAFVLWGRAREGKSTDAINDWIKEREAWMARHFENKNIAGVIAQVKWGGIGSRGEGYMKNLINEEKAKYKKKKYA